MTATAWAIQSVPTATSWGAQAGQSTALQIGIDPNATVTPTWDSQIVWGAGGFWDSTAAVDIWQSETA